MAFSIVSLNAWGGALHAPLLAYLAGLEADVLCLQEITRCAGRAPGWLTYRDGATVLPQRADLFAELRAVLPRHQPFYCPTARGVLFDGEDDVQAEFGLASFVGEGHAIVDQAIGFIHGDFSPSGWGPHPRSRNAHGLRVHDHATGRTMTIIQLHGLRDPAGKGDTPARQAQAEALVAFIRRIWPGDEGLVVAGDFNLLPDSHTFTMLAELGLRDLVTGHGFTDTRTSHYPKPGRYADYLLVTPDVPVASFEVVAEPEVSDHRALRLTIG